MNLVLALTHLGRILGEDNSLSLDRREEGAMVLERAFQIADTFVHKGPSDQMARGRLAMAGITLANILRHSDARRALVTYHHVLRHLAEIGDNASFRRYEVSALAGSTYALRRLGRPAEARQRLDSAFERLRRLKSYPAEKIRPASEPDEALCALADYEAGRGNISEAVEIYRKLLEQVLAWEPKPSTNLGDAVGVSRLYTALAALHRRAHQAEAASDLETRRRQLWRHWDKRLPHGNFVRRQLNADEHAVP